MEEAPDVAQAAAAVAAEGVAVEVAVVAGAEEEETSVIYAAAVNEVDRLACGKRGQRSVVSGQAHVRAGEPRREIFV